MLRRSTPTSRAALLRGRRRARVVASRMVRAELISVAGMVGRPILNPTTEAIGRVADVVVRWEGETYPPVTGLVASVGRRTSFVPISEVAVLERHRVQLSSGRVDLIGYHHRGGEVALAGDVMDRQLVDVDGIRVVRAADLYLARQGNAFVLVGVDVGVQSLIRRLGPARFRTRATPDRVIDWAAIQPFAGSAQAGVRLTRANQELHRMRPADLADLLEQLGRPQRQELLEVLGPQVAADALEEMEREPLTAILRDTPDPRAAALIAEMEPDEAVEALRDLDPERRDALLMTMPPEQVRALAPMLQHPEESAGGIMTSSLIIVDPSEPVRDVRSRLRELRQHAEAIDNVSVLDADGQLLDEISLFELATAEDTVTMGELVGPPWPITVATDASLAEIVECLVANRRSSIVVLDDQGRPVGRILADDVVDALVSDRGRVRFPRVVE